MMKPENSLWMQTLRSDPLRWLLQKNNPCVRYRTLTDILDLPDADAQVAEAREAAWHDPLVKRLLAALSSVEPFPKKTVWWQKLFKGNYGDLDTLYRFGVPAGHPVIREACDQWLDVDIPPDAECYPKQMIGGLVRYADPEDARLKAKVRYVIENEPFADGNRPGVLRYAEGPGRGSCCGSHSCYSAAMRSLWAVMGVSPTNRSRDVCRFLEKGATFLAAHNLYQSNHREFKPIKEGWLSLNLPFGLGWQTDLLDILDIASQIGLHEHQCMLSGLRALLSKQTTKGRWCLEASVPFDDGRLVSLVRRAEPVGRESKWITLAALRVLKRCESLLARISDGDSLPKPSVCQAPTFSDHAFKYSRADETRVRARWHEFGMGALLDDVVDFKKERRLRLGWHWGVVIGPKSCPEWCSAMVRWVPRKGDKMSWPVARVFFLSGRKQFTAEDLSRRLDIPVEDEDEKKRFKKFFWGSLWRVKVAKWRDNFDEVGVTLRSPDEFERLRPVLKEALRTVVME